MSVNTYFVQLELDTGMCRVTKMAKKLGVKLGTPGPRPGRLLPAHPGLHPGLGRGQPAVDGRGVRDLRGPRHPLRPDHHRSRSPPGPGRSSTCRDGNCQRVMTEDVADGMNKLLAGVMTNGTGTRARTCRRSPAGRQDRHHQQQRGGLVRRLHPGDRRRRDDLHRQHARSRSSRAGRPRRPASSAGSGVKGYRVPSTDFVPGRSGSGDAGMKIWKPTMERYLADIPRTSFKSPPSRIERGKMVDVPSIFGLGIRRARRSSEKAGFNVARTCVYSDGCRRAASSAGRRGRGSRAPQFSTIFAHVLAGPGPGGGRRRAAADGGRGERRTPTKKARQEEEGGGEKKAARRRPAERPRAADDRRRLSTGGEPSSDRPGAACADRRPRCARRSQPAPDRRRVSAAGGAPPRPRRRRRPCPWSAGYNAHHLADALRSELGGPGPGDGVGDDGCDLVGGQRLRQVVGQHRRLGPLLLCQLVAAGAA